MGSLNIYAFFSTIDNPIEIVSSAYKPQTQSLKKFKEHKPQFRWN